MSPSVRQSRLPLPNVLAQEDTSEGPIADDENEIAPAGAISRDILSLPTKTGVVELLLMPVGGVENATE
jgi:hypothetical protein